MKKISHIISEWFLGFGMGDGIAGSHIVGCQGIDSLGG